MPDYEAIYRRAAELAAESRAGGATTGVGTGGGKGRLVAEAKPAAPKPQSRGTRLLKTIGRLTPEPVKEGLSAVGKGLQTVSSGERTANLLLPGDPGTAVRRQIEKVPVVGGVLATAADIATAPATLATVGMGGPGGLLARGLGKAGRAGRITEGLLSPVSKSKNVANRLYSEVVLGTGATYAAEKAEEAGAPLPLTLGAALLGGGVALGVARAGQGAAMNLARSSAEDVTKKWGYKLDGGNRYVFSMPDSDDVLGGIKTTDNEFVKLTAGSAAVNPSLSIQTALGKVRNAYIRLSERGRTLGELASGMSIDPHNKGAGIALGRGGRLLDFGEDGIVRNVVPDKPGRSLHWGDIFEDPDRVAHYGLDAEQNAAIEDFLTPFVEMRKMLVDEGIITAKQAEDWAKSLYVPRVVQELGGVEVAGRTNPMLARVFDTQAQAAEQGVKYLNDPRMASSLYLQSAYQALADKRLNDMMKPFLIGPKDVMRAAKPGTVNRLENAVKKELGLRRQAQLERRAAVRATTIAETKGALGEALTEEEQQLLDLAKQMPSMKERPEVKAALAKQRALTAQGLQTAFAKGLTQTPESKAFIDKYRAPGTFDQWPETVTPEMASAARSMGIEVVPEGPPPPVFKHTLNPEKPQAGSGEAALRRLEKEGFSTDEARSALDDYKDIDRADFEDIEDYRAERQDAWATFVEAVTEAEHATWEPVGTTAKELRSAMMGGGVTPPGVSPTAPPFQIAAEVSSLKRPPVQAKPLSADLQKQLADARRETRAARNEYKIEMDRLRKGPKSVLPAYIFGNNETDKLVPVGTWKGSFLESNADYEKLRTEVNTMTGRPYPVQMSKWLTKLSDVSNDIRFASASGDLAMPFIHGLPLLGQNPVLWAKMAANHFRGFLNPSFAGKYIEQNRQTVIEMAQHGVPVGDVETLLATEKGLLKRATETGVGKQTIGRLMSAYDTGITAARVQLWDSLKPVWDGTPEELATYVKAMTGGTSSAALGIGPRQRILEGTWLAFSPRLMRSTIGLIAMAADPSTPEGRQAARSLLGLAAFGATSAVLTNMGIGMALGEDEKQIKQRIEDTLNPLAGRKFLAANINDQWIGVGGQVRAISQFVAKSLADPAGFASANSMENPLINFYMGRGAIGTRVAGGFLEGATGERINFLPFENIDSIPSAVLHMDSLALPFVIQSALEAEEVSNLDRAFIAGVSFGGARVSEETASQKIAQEAVKRYSKPWAELTGQQQQELEADRPDLFELRAKQAAQWGGREDHQKQKLLEDNERRRLNGERMLADAFAKGQLTPEEFRDELKALQRDAAVIKREALGDVTPNTSDANKKALSAWYDLYDQAKVPGTEVVNWNTHDQLEADLFRQLTPEQINFINQRRQVPHAPEVQGYYANEDAIRESGYYETIDAAFARLRSAMPDTITSYSDLVKAINAATIAGDIATTRRLSALRNRIDDIAGTQKRILRIKNPGLDRALVQNGRVGVPVTQARR